MRPRSIERVVPNHAFVLEEKSLIAERACCQLCVHLDVGDVSISAALGPVGWLVPGPHLEQGSTGRDPHQLLLEANNFSGSVNLLLTAKEIPDLSSRDVAELEWSDIVLD